MTVVVVVVVVVAVVVVSVRLIRSPPLHRNHPILVQILCVFFTEILLKVSFANDAPLCRGVALAAIILVCVVYGLRKREDSLRDTGRGTGRGFRRFRRSYSTNGTPHLGYIYHPQSRHRDKNDAIYREVSRLMPMPTQTRRERSP